MSMAEVDKYEGKYGSLVVSAISAMVSLGLPLSNGVSLHNSSYLQRIERNSSQSTRIQHRSYNRIPMDHQSDAAPWPHLKIISGAI